MRFAQLMISRPGRWLRILNRAALHPRSGMTTKRSRILQTTIRRILVPVDFSASSLHAASFAFALARQLGCEVRCTTVVDVLDLRIAMRAGLHDFETNADLQRQVRRWIKGEFDKLTAVAGMAVQREVRRGIPEHEILKSVRRYQPDLIVMGSIGIARRFPLGSRTRFVMRKTAVPVLVIRASDDQRAAPAEVLAEGAGERCAMT